jgi:hypothetical protein
MSVVLQKTESMFRFLNVRRVQKMKKTIVMIFAIGILLTMAMPMFTSTQTVDTLSARGKPASGSCIITSPSDGATVSDTVTITVDASAAPTIYIDGTEVTTGYSYDWDTTGVADGDYIIKAEVSKKTKDQISVTVANGGTPPPPPPPDGDGVVRKWALVIGISDYMDDANDLEYCDDDAMAWKSYLQGEGYTVDLVLDHQATADNIYDAYMNLAANEDADDMVAFCYSGHGYYYRTIRESCLVSTDGYLLPSSEFASVTFDSQHVFMFLDCCNIGTFSDLCGTGWVAGIGSNTRTYTYDGTAEMGHGYYTYFAMDAIYNQGYTTAEDICNYARDMFNAYTPGKASTVDMYDGLMDI